MDEIKYYPIYSIDSDMSFIMEDVYDSVTGDLKQTKLVTGVANTDLREFPHEHLVNMYTENYGHYVLGDEEFESEDLSRRKVVLSVAYCEDTDISVLIETVTEHSPWNDTLASTTRIVDWVYGSPEVSLTEWYFDHDTTMTAKF